MPSNPTDAKGLLLASIRDPNPVVFFEPKALYRASVEDVSPYSYQSPFISMFYISIYPNAINTHVIIYIGCIV